MQGYGGHGNWRDMSEYVAHLEGLQGTRYAVSSRVG